MNLTIKARERLSDAGPRAASTPALISTNTPLRFTVHSKIDTANNLPLSSATPGPARILSRPAYIPPPSLQDHTGVNLILPPEFANLHSSLYQLAFAPATRAGHGTAVTRFIDFARSIKAENQALPASEGLLVAWLASLIGQVSGATASKYLSAIKHWHTVLALPFPGRTDLIRLAIAAATAQTPGASLRHERPPVTVPMLEAIRSRLNPTTIPRDAAVWACATFTFWTMCRLGETTVPSGPSFNPLKHPTRSNLHAEVKNGHRYYCLRLPWTKTTKEKGARAATGTFPHVDPVQALDWHLFFNKPPPSAHVFAYRSGDTWISLTKSAFMLAINDSLLATGHSALTGHSFRIGGANTYREAGMSKEFIKILGRWSSDAIDAYFRTSAAFKISLQQSVGESRSAYWVAVPSTGVLRTPSCAERPRERPATRLD